MMQSVDETVKEVEKKMGRELTDNEKEFVKTLVASANEIMDQYFGKQ